MSYPNSRVNIGRTSSSNRVTTISLDRIDLDSVVWRRTKRRQTSRSENACYLVTWALRPIDIGAKRNSSTCNDLVTWLLRRKRFARNPGHAATPGCGKHLSWRREA